METIEATYRIVTPMFIGGANQDPSDGIRPPSFKGALRFWWRALNWGKFYQDCDGDEAAALKALHKKESELFGSAAKDGKGGQGAFLLTLAELGMRKTINDWPKPNTGAGYLAYGILASKGGKRGKPVPHRIGIVENHKFKVQLAFRLNSKQEDIDSIREAVETLGLVGGLGSRSRRGFGSLSTESLKSLEEYKSDLERLFLPSTKLAPFTAFSNKTLIQTLEPFQDVKKAIESVGKKYKEHRASIINDRHKRVSYGLPLQAVDEKNRRASPLLIHIQALADGTFLPVVMFLPSSKFHHVNQYQNIGFSDVESFVRSIA